MKKHGIAIIGTGNIAKEHVEACLAFPERVSVNGVCDIFTDKAEAFCKKYSLSCVVEKDYNVLLDRDDIDMVAICLPPSVHKEVAIAAMRKGKAVLCEKPMAASLEEADEMIRVSQETGCLLSVISQNRFRNSLYKVKKILSQGLVGKILFIRVNSSWYRGDNYYKLWWRGTWEKEGGGCTLNHAVHQIDILNYIMGEMPLSITSVMANLAHPNSEVEDISLSLLKYPCALSSITVSLLNHDERQGFEIIAEKATLNVPWSFKAVKQKENGFFLDNEDLEKEIQKAYDSIPDLEYEGHAGQLLNFLNAADGIEPLLVDGNAGREALSLIYGIYESAITNKEVALPLMKGSEFYTKNGLLAAAPRYHEKTESLDNLEGNITLGRQ